MKSFPIEAIVLVGGLGTRLGELTKLTPKPLLPINKKPFLEYLVLNLKKQGIKRIVFSIAYHGDLIRKHFGNGSVYGLEFIYSDSKNELLGTGGSVKLASSNVYGNDFFVLNGDVFFDIDYKKLYKKHLESNSLITIALKKIHEETRRYGTVELSRDSKIIQFAEKTRPISKLINGGVYIFEKQAIDSLPHSRVSSLEYDLFQKLSGYCIYGCTFEKSFFIDIGTHEDYEVAQQVLPGVCNVS